MRTLAFGAGGPHALAESANGERHGWSSNTSPFACRSRSSGIWPAPLAAQPGFGGKETWREAGRPDALHLIIRWETGAAWQSVPKAVLADTDRRFTAALGASFPVLSCTAYEVLG